MISEMEGRENGEVEFDAELARPDRYREAK